MIFYLSTCLTNAFALPGETESRKLRVSFTPQMLLRQQTHKTHWSHLIRTLFAQESIVCNKQNLGIQYSMLSSVVTHSSFTKTSCGDVSRCVESESCSLSSLKWNVNGSHLWDILLSQQTLSVIEHVLDV